MDDFERLRRTVEEWTPAPPTVAFLALGKNVVERLMGLGLLRHDAEDDAYYLPMGNVGMGIHGFGDVPVTVSEHFPDLLFGQYSDGTYFTNGEAGTAAQEP